MCYSFYNNYNSNQLFFWDPAPSTEICLRVGPSIVRLCYILTCMYICNYNYINHLYIIYTSGDYILMTVHVDSG